MASITRSAHSPNVAPSDGLPNVLWIDALRELGAGLRGQFAGACKRHVARRTEADLGGLAVPAIQETPTAGRRSAKSRDRGRRRRRGDRAR